MVPFFIFCEFGSLSEVDFFLYKWILSLVMLFVRIPSPINGQEGENKLRMYRQWSPRFF